MSGGIWKTQDAGRRWRPLDDLMVTIAVSSLAMDPADPDVIYAGTGEGQFREVVRGAGIFKTVDGGESWSQLEATVNANLRRGEKYRRRRGGRGLLPPPPRGFAQS